ncbi:MAG: hypothetical protein MK171_08790 [Pirellulales bacterium]|nr:hypothetical protein [Pirellulales bacterium]
MRHVLSLWMAVLVTSVMPLCAGAAEWGSLKGQLVFDGTPPESKSIQNIAPDTEFCSKNELVDETLVVGEERGLANAFVYLYLKKGKTVAVHPDLAEPSDKPVVLDNKGCRFHPRALLVRTGQPFEIRNSDMGVGHNTNLQTLFSNPPFNQMVVNGKPETRMFQKRESFPAPAACNIHTWMKAFVLIRDNPYMAVSDARGNFEIKDIPAGPHEFIFWHDPAGMRGMAVGKKETDRKGRVKLDIAAGKTLDLGEIKVSASALRL